MRFRSTINSQPKAIADSIRTAQTELERLDTTNLGAGLIAVTGIGASFAAATVLAAHLVHCGRRAIALRCVDLNQFKGIADCIIALSHRGTSVEVVESVLFQSSTPSLAISRNPSSPLATAADMHLLLDNGIDSTPSSNGYTCTLAACGVLCEKICASPNTNWDQVVQQSEELLDGVADEVRRAGKIFADCRVIDCVGESSAFGTADGTSLLIREAARIPASAFDVRHYLHGPMEAMEKGTGLVVIGNGREIVIAQELAKAGCPVLLITSKSEVKENDSLRIIRTPVQSNYIAQAILDILPAQLFAAELSDLRGLTNTKFRYIQSDTKIAEENNPASINA